MDQQPVAPTPMAPKPQLTKRSFRVPPYIYGVVVILAVAVLVMMFLPQESIAPDTTSDRVTTTSSESPLVVTSPVADAELSTAPMEISGQVLDSAVKEVSVANVGNGMGVNVGIAPDGTWSASTELLGIIVGGNTFRITPLYGDRSEGAALDFSFFVSSPPTVEDAGTFTVSWLEQPVRIEFTNFLGRGEKIDQYNQMLKSEEGYKNEAWAYKTGVVASGEYKDDGIYMFSTGFCFGQEMGCNSSEYRVLKDRSSGKISLLGSYSDAVSAEEIGLIDEVLNSVRIPGLAAPDSFALMGLVLERTETPWMGEDEMWFFDQELVSITSHSLYGTVYTTPATSDTSSLHALYLKLPDGRVAIYKFNIPFVMDGRVPSIVWTDGTSNTTDYTSASTRGCGGTDFFSVVALDVLKPSERLIRAGTTSTGQPVYTFRNSEDARLKEMYEAYRPYRPEGEEIISYDEFVARRPVFYWQDPFGRWIEFSRIDLLAAVECGKPVIYLYPEKEIVAHVIVGLKGKMTVSDPPHGVRGWKVIARPDGYVVVDGKIYPNLFWEGTGVNYEIPKQGFVMETKNADVWFTKTLQEIGFTERENAEFREFWVPRLPQTPYVFVTFVPQKDFDRDAPLYITPRPDRMFRVFMESRGLYEPIAVDPLPLPKIVRDGFTVVEWGGALR